MRKRLEEFGFPLAACGLGGVLLAWWLAGTSGGDIRLRLPNQDGLPPTLAPVASVPVPVVAGEPRRGGGEPATVAASWKGFRGNRRDGIADDGVGLLKTWPSEGLPIRWSVTLGEGYAGAAIAGGCVYVLDYDEEALADTLRCLSLDDGREIWSNSYPVKLTRNHGLSRTVPAVVGGKVVTFGPRCHVACWDGQTGNCDWLIDLVRDHGASVPQWYAGQCPLVDQGRVILAPGGEALLIAINLHTSEVVWKTPNPRGWEMTHSSIMPMEHEGRRSYLYCGSGGIAAVAADDGHIVWDSTDWPTTFATCPSPLVLPEGKIFLCSGYGRAVGSLLLQVQTAESGLVAKRVLELTPGQFNAEHQTPIFYQGHVYGVRKRGGGQLACLDQQGRELWNSGADRFGHGPYLIADERIFIMNDHGELTMARATPEGYQRLGQRVVFPDGHDAWGPMALASGRLVLREMTRMACLDIAEQ